MIQKQYVGRLAAMLKAVIFDLDGVIADTMQLHPSAEARLLKRKFGISIEPDEISRKYAGQSLKVIFADIISNHGLPVPDIAPLEDEKYGEVLDAFRKNPQPIPGVITFIRALKKEGIRMGVASGSRIDFVRGVLDALEITEMFQMIATADDVKNGKPSPDLFLHVAKKLGADPGSCVVIEDARNGILAAKAGGMKCIGIQGDTDVQDLTEADLIVKDFEGLDIGKCRELVS